MESATRAETKAQLVLELKAYTDKNENSFARLALRREKERRPLCIFQSDFSQEPAAPIVLSKTEMKDYTKNSNSQFRPIYLPDYAENVVSSPTAHEQRELSSPPPLPSTSPPLLLPSSSPRSTLDFSPTSSPPQIPRKVSSTSIQLVSPNNNTTSLSFTTAIASHQLPPSPPTPPQLPPSPPTPPQLTSSASDSEGNTQLIPILVIPPPAEFTDSGQFSFSSSSDVSGEDSDLESCYSGVTGYYNLLTRGDFSDNVPRGDNYIQNENQPYQISKYKDQIKTVRSDIRPGSVEELKQLFLIPGSKRHGKGRKVPRHTKRRKPLSSRARSGSPRAVLPSSGMLHVYHAAASDDVSPRLSKDLNDNFNMDIFPKTDTYEISKTGGVKSPCTEENDNTIKSLSQTADLEKKLALNENSDIQSHIISDADSSIKHKLYRCVLQQLAETTSKDKASPVEELLTVSHDLLAKQDIPEADQSAAEIERKQLDACSIDSSSVNSEVVDETANAQNVSKAHITLIWCNSGELSSQGSGAVVDRADRKQISVEKDDVCNSDDSRLMLSELCPPKDVISAGLITDYSGESHKQNTHSSRESENREFEFGQKKQLVYDANNDNVTTLSQREDSKLRIFGQMVDGFVPGNMGEVVHYDFDTVNEEPNPDEIHIEVKPCQNTGSVTTVDITNSRTEDEEISFTVSHSPEHPVSTSSTDVTLSSFVTSDDPQNTVNLQMAATNDKTKRCSPTITDHDVISDGRALPVSHTEVLISKDTRASLNPDYQHKNGYDSETSDSSSDESDNSSQESIRDYKPIYKEKDNESFTSDGPLHDYSTTTELLLKPSVTTLQSGEITNNINEMKQSSYSFLTVNTPSQNEEIPMYEHTSETRIGANSDGQNSAKSRLLMSSASESVTPEERQITELHINACLPKNPSDDNDFILGGSPVPQPAEIKHETEKPADDSDTGDITNNIDNPTVTTALTKPAERYTGPYITSGEGEINDSHVTSSLTNIVLSPPASPPVASKHIHVLHGADDNPVKSVVPERSFRIDFRFQTEDAGANADIMPEKSSGTSSNMKVVELFKDHKTVENAYDSNDAVAILPSLAEAVSKCNMDTGLGIPEISQTISKLGDGANLVITTMTRKVVEEETENKRPESPVEKDGDLFLVQDSRGNIYYVEDVSEEQESAYFSSTDGSGGSAIQNLRAVGDNNIGYNTAEEVISAMFQEQGSMEIDERQNRETTMKMNGYGPGIIQPVGFTENSSNKYTTNYAYDAPRQIVPVSKTSETTRRAYEMSSGGPLVDGNQNYTTALNVADLDSLSSMSSAGPYDMNYNETTQRSHMDNLGYMSNSASYKMEAMAAIPQLISQPIITPVPPTPVIQPQYKLVKVDMTPKDDQVTTTTTHITTIERPIYKTVAIIKGPDSPKFNSSYKVQKTGATDYRETQERYMQFDETDTASKKTVGETFILKSPTLPSPIAPERRKHKIQKEAEIRRTPSLGKYKTTIDVQTDNPHASAGNYEFSETRRYKIDRQKQDQEQMRREQSYEIRTEPQRTTEPDVSRDLRVVRGNILIKNTIDEPDATLDDNINFFHREFALNKDNPLYQSDEDIYRKYDAEREAEQNRQNQFQRDLNQDITFETVDKFTKSKEVFRQPPKQNLSQLLLSRLSNIDSKDIHQTINVEHHNEEIYGDINFLHADGSKSGSTGTQNFDTVGEKVDLKLALGKAYITIKVTAERIIPIDYEFNVWRKSQAIVTRQIEIDLFANDQRRRLYEQVMDTAGMTGAIGYGEHGRQAPKERVLDSRETMNVFSQILTGVDNEGDREDITIRTRQRKAALPDLTKQSAEMLF